MNTANVVPRTPTGPWRGWMILAWIAGCHAAGAIGAVATDSSLYRELVRPGWAPPGWLFGPVWMVLYTAIGVAGWALWRAPGGRPRRVALTAFAVQLALNTLWTPVFFGLESIGGALIVIVLLAAAIALTIASAWRVSWLAAALLLPYLAWVGFATALNAALWLLNR
jgi:tryptophan-rich sensory protein